MGKGDIVDENPIKAYNSHQCSTTSHQYSQTINLDNDTINLNRPELEGTQEVGRNNNSSAQLPQPLEIKQVHIGSSKNPNFDNVQDYSYGEAVAKIADLMQEYRPYSLPTAQKGGE